MKNEEKKMKKTKIITLSRWSSTSLNDERGKEKERNIISYYAHLNRFINEFWWLYMFIIFESCWSIFQFQYIISISLQHVQTFLYSTSNTYLPRPSFSREHCWFHQKESIKVKILNNCCSRNNLRTRTDVFLKSLKSDSLKEPGRKRLYQVWVSFKSGEVAIDNKSSNCAFDWFMGSM